MCILVAAGLFTAFPVVAIGLNVVAENETAAFPHPDFYGTTGSLLTAVERPRSMS